MEQLATESVRKVGFAKRLYAGRLGRLDYFFFHLFVAGFFAIAVILLITLTNVIDVDNPENKADHLWLGGILLAYVPFLILITSAWIRRMHDLDMSGWWLLLGLIPPINLIFAFVLWFAPGTNGVNRFGEVNNQGRVWIRFFGSENKSI